MSASSINRSLATIRTELDFLQDSEVITQDVYRNILSSLPERYDPSANKGSAPEPQNEFVEAIYAFQAQQDGDLNLQVGDKIEVLEKPSPEWYKGKCNGRVGMFPSNYVKPAFSGTNAVETGRSNLAAPPPQYQSQQFLQSQQTNTSAQSNYSQPPFPPQSTSYYQAPPPQQYQSPQAYYQAPPQQQPEQQQQQQQQAQPQQGHHANAAFKKFGGKLGNAAIFGAGATIGSDLVNSIF
ncbi:LANO_0D02278g1_1 [Lachancea nothofagi CBS 11611]|uniref:LANO_0D02278g1_1 n=1 Tax=Lachancea nothofagi CBS 11611 TaxID=1266666 RepID=A0A1G4JEU8_9SACH|nr:LANO_0D02278g1_1 [Lachancea nothofagi CBS 11611]